MIDDWRSVPRPCQSGPSVLDRQSDRRCRIHCPPRTVNTMFVDFTSVRRLCDLPSVWRQIEGAGRLRGTADACPEKKEGLQNVTVALFSPFPSGSASLVCLSHSLKRRLVSYRCLLSSEAFSLPRSLNCLCVTERKRSNLQPVSTPHISSRESAKKVGNCVGGCVSPQSGHCVRNATVRR